MYALHLMGAKLLQTPELELETEEAEKLAGAVARVNALYNDFPIPEKWAAWINLLIVCGTVYGPRAIAASARMKSEKKPAPLEVVQ